MPAGIGTIFNKIKNMENEVKQIQISVDPNVYSVTNVSIVSNEEDFHFAITSGNQVRQFSASPKHAKRILLLLSQQIEAHEAKFGEIKTQLPKMPQNANSKDETKLGF
jgi:hypothetical protein